MPLTFPSMSIPSRRASGVLRSLWLVIPVFVGACGGTQSEPVTPNGESEPERTVAEPVEVQAEPEGPDPRRLMAGERTFGELLRVASDLTDQQSDNRCVFGLSAASGAISLEADIAPGTRPLPDAESGLGARAHGRAAVVTPWGVVGDGQAPLSLASLTLMPPVPSDALSFVLVITASETRLVPTGQGAGAAVDEAALATTLPEDAWVFVTADADVTLERISSLVARLGQRNVSLAAALPEGTAFAAPEPVALDGMCSEAEWPEPEGAEDAAVDPQAALRVLRPIAQQAVERCVSSGRGARGGRVMVALRFGVSGAVTQACAEEDSVGDTILRTCIVESFRQARLDPPPAPQGDVDMMVPVRWSAPPMPSPRGVCSLP